MARFNPIQHSFTSGILSQRLRGRDDLEQYQQGMRQALNGIVLPHGGLQRRPGTYFVHEAGGTSTRTALIPFAVDNTQQYVIEAGSGYFRFFANNGIIESSPGVPYSIATAFTTDIAPELRYAQRADVMYLVQKNHQVYKLSRTGVSTFAIAAVTYVGGKAPMRPANATTTTVAAVLIAGISYTLTWSASVGLTTAEDVGRAVKVVDGVGVERYYKITAVSSTTVAIADLLGGVHDATARQDWSLGLFSDTEGPRCVTFHEGRLWYGGARNTPDYLVGSKSDDYDNFDLGNGSDADLSIAKRVVSAETNVLVWMRSQAAQLVVGATSGEFRVVGAAGDILTPTSTTIRQATAQGSAEIDAVAVNSAILFPQRARRSIFEFRYELTADTYRSKNFTILAEDIFDDNALGEGGIVKMAYQQDPNSVIWCVRGDGRLVGITYEPNQKVAGAHLHDFGGDVEDIAVISGQTAREQLWLVITYEIGGVDKRYICRMAEPFRPALGRRSTPDQRMRALDDAFFVDAGLSLDTAKTISSITQANPAVVTSVAHGFSNGQRVKLRIPTRGEAANPMPDDNMHELDNRSCVVAGATANTFQLLGVDSTSYTAYVANGTARAEVTTVSGLDHLEGRTVQVLADGAVHPDRTVSAGAITLARRASIVHAGLAAPYRGETQRIVGGAKIGTDQGQTTKIQRIAVSLHNSLGGSLGTGDGLRFPLDDLQYRDGDTNMDQSPPLYTGDKEIAVEGGWNDDGDATAYWENLQPLPMTVVAIMPRAKTNER